MRSTRQLPRTWWGLLLALLGVAISVYLSSGTGGTGGSGEDAGAAPAPQSSTSDPASGLAWVDLADLPPEASDTVALIEDGGPYPYDQDDGTFGNFEGILPDEPRGYYREYTVETPGSPDRGARRIVSGSQGELYWTADHYQSFDRIRR